MPYPYAPKPALDAQGDAIQNAPFPKLSNQTTVGTPAVSSVISFNVNTSAIEIAAGNSPVALKWGPASVIAVAGTANYDHIIPANSYRRFVIPIQSQGVSSVVGINAQAGLYSSAAVIVASSVLTGLTEY